MIFLRFKSQSFPKIYRCILNDQHLTQSYHAILTHYLINKYLCPFVAGRAEISQDRRHDEEISTKRSGGMPVDRFWCNTNVFCWVIKVCDYFYASALQLPVHISKRTPQDTRAHVPFFHEWLVSIRYIMKIMMDPRINKCILVLGIIFISLLVQASQEQNRFKFYTKALFVSLAHLLHSGDALQEPPHACTEAKKEKR